MGIQGRNSSLFSTYNIISLFTLPHLPLTTCLLRGAVETIPCLITIFSLFLSLCARFYVLLAFAFGRLSWLVSVGGGRYIGKRVLEIIGPRDEMYQTVPTLLGLSLSLVDILGWCSVCRLSGGMHHETRGSLNLSARFTWSFCFVSTSRGRGGCNVDLSLDCSSHVPAQNLPVTCLK
jgi:hypothetical protein